MNTESESRNACQALMNGYRALDLTDPQGYVCGMILAQFGFDHIKVEGPEGEPGRHR